MLSPFDLARLYAPVQWVYEARGDFGLLSVVAYDGTRWPMAYGPSEADAWALHAELSSPERLKVQTGRARVFKPNLQNIPIRSGEPCRLSEAVKNDIRRGK